MKSLSVSLLLILTSGTLVYGEHSHICFRPPGTDEWQNLTGLGLDRFPSSDYFWGLWKGSNEDQLLDPKNDKFNINMTVYAISADKNYLNGWFRVKLAYFPDKNIRDGIKMFVLWIENDLHEVIGEWITDKEFPRKFDQNRDCPANDLTRYMSISCGGAYPTQPIVSNVALWVRNESSNATLPKNKFPDLNFVGPAVPLGDKKEFNFYVRFSTHTCFWFRNFSIKGRAVGDDQIFLFPIQWSVDGIPGELTGAADLVPTDPKVDIHCSTKLSEGGNDFSPIYSKLDRGRGCQSNLFGGRCPYNNQNIQELTEGGTADLSKRQNQAEEDLFPTCRDKSWSNSTSRARPEIGTRSFTKRNGLPRSTHDLLLGSHDYNIYIDTILATEECNANENTCTSSSSFRRNLTQVELQSELLVSDVNLETSTEIQYDSIKGLPFTKEFIMLWNLRKGHGCANVIATVFLIPVSVFLSRYYKETFMANRIFFSRFWYQIHIHCSGWIAVLMISGGIVAHACYHLLGPSLTVAGLLHRIFGYGAYLALAMVVLGGGVRSIDMGTRKCMICCHWMWGTILYLFNTVCIITAVMIPGSPIASKDVSEFPEEVLWSHTAVILICFWWIFDILIHGLMSALTKMYDLNMDVEAHRLYCPVPIPVLRESEVLDADGRTLRLFILILYVMAALTVTLFICGLIYQSPYENKGFGPMYCTYDDDGNSLLPQIRSDCALFEV